MDHAGLEFSTFPKSGGLVSPAEFAGMTGGIAGDATLESIRCLIVHLVKQFLKFVPRSCSQTLKTDSRGHAAGGDNGHMGRRGPVPG